MEFKQTKFKEIQKEIDEIVNNKNNNKIKYIQEEANSILFYMNNELNKNQENVNLKYKQSSFFLFTKYKQALLDIQNGKFSNTENDVKYTIYLILILNISKNTSKFNNTIKVEYYSELMDIAIKKIKEIKNFDILNKKFYQNPKLKLKYKIFLIIYINRYIFYHFKVDYLTLLSFITLILKNNGISSNDEVNDFIINKFINKYKGSLKFPFLPKLYHYPSNFINPIHINPSKSETEEIISIASKIYKYMNSDSSIDIENVKYNMINFDLNHVSNNITIKLKHSYFFLFSKYEKALFDIKNGNFYIKNSNNNIEYKNRHDIEDTLDLIRILIISKNSTNNCNSNIGCYNVNYFSETFNKIIKNIYIKYGSEKINKSLYGYSPFNIIKLKNLIFLIINTNKFLFQYFKVDFYTLLYFVEIIIDIIELEKHSRGPYEFLMLHYIIYKNIQKKLLRFHEKYPNIQQNFIVGLKNYDDILSFKDPQIWLFLSSILYNSHEFQERMGRLKMGHFKEFKEFLKEPKMPSNNFKYEYKPIFD